MTRKSSGSERSWVTGNLVTNDHKLGLHTGSPKKRCPLCTGPTTMTRAQAMAKARKRWPGKAWSEYRKDAPSPETRAAARDELAEHRKGKPGPQPEATRGDTTYADTLLDWREEMERYRKTERAIMGIALASPRCRIGYVGEIGAVRVAGTGDTWEEAWAAAENSDV